MKLDRWEIVFARKSESDLVGHPAVILSGSDILSDSRPLRFNALMGTKRPPAAKVLPHQVLLDQADGLEFATVLNCALVYVVRKNSILRRAGIVSHMRRAEISRRVRASLGIW
jgi:mRNA-degrading endonuclease toxin of MazEF toxin-antitoxin module